MKNRYSLLTVASLAFSLVACQSIKTHDSVSNIRSIQPPAKGYTAQAHPLGADQTADFHRHGVAYLLTGELVKSEPLRAKKACQALFNESELEQPAVALSPNHLVTFLPVNKIGDFRRTSTRFKWGICNHLVRFIDSVREQAILTAIDYPKVRGPLLVAVGHFDGADASRQRALIADLSRVPESELSAAIANWKHTIAPDQKLWRGATDLDQLHVSVNAGLIDQWVALSVWPDPFDSNAVPKVSAR